MVSFPGTLADTSPDSLVGANSQIILPMYMYMYDPESFSYVEAIEIEPGKGYWILTMADETLTADITFSSGYMINLKAGWNMVGSIYIDTNFSDPQDAPDGSVILPIYTYSPTSFGYYEDTMIETGMGYWVLALQDCSLTVGEVIPIEEPGFIDGLVVDASNDLPLEGAKIAVSGIAGESLSGADGKYAYPVQESGEYDVTISRVGYTTFQHKIDAVKGRDVAMKTARLTPLDTKKNVIPPSEGGVATDSAGTIKLDIPPGAIEQTTNVEITATKIEKEEQMPGDVPENAILLYGVDLKPDGLKFNESAKLSFANTLGLPAGLEFPLVYWDRETLEWIDTGMAKVSDDGAWMECSIQHFTYYQGHGSSLHHKSTPNPSDETPLVDGCAGDSSASKVSYYSGSLTKDYTISQTRSLGISTGATLIYNSNTAFPNILIATQSNTEVMPNTLTWHASIEGNRVEAIFMAVNSNTYQAFLFNGKNGRGQWLSTGSYFFKVKFSNNYATHIYTTSRFGGDPLKDTGHVAPELSSLSNSLEGRFAINNQINSHFGAGWSLDGLQRLHIDHDGYVVITHGDGSRLIFSPQQPDANGDINYTSPAGDFSKLIKQGHGIFTRTMKDGTKIQFSYTGFHTTTTDRNGNTTTYSYEDGRLSSVTDPVGRVTDFHYDNRGYLTSVTDPIGRITQFEVDNNDDLVKITGPNDSINEYKYNSDHLLTFHTDPRKYVTEYQYKYGRISKVIRPNGQERVYEIAQTKGLINDIPEGHGTGENPAEPVYSYNIFSKSFSCSCGGPPASYRFDRLGGVLEYIDVLGRNTLTERDANSNPTKITMPNGEATTMAYDGMGNLLTSKEASNGAITSFTYDPRFNQVTSVTDPKGNKTQISYDPHGNPVEIMDALEQKTIMTYNDRGLRTSIEDTLENTTTFDYDSKGNLIATTDPMGNKTELTYDDAGNVIASKDAESNITEFTYDTMNRLISVKDAGGGVTEYDSNDNLAKVTDANGHFTMFGYNQVNELVSTTDPLRRNEVFEYSQQGNLIARKDRNSQTTNFVYNDANQLTRKTLTGDKRTLYSYDIAGNISVIKSPENATIMDYNPQNRLVNSYTISTPNVQVDAIITREKNVGADDTSLDGLDILIYYANVTIDGEHTFGNVWIISSNVTVNGSLSAQNLSLAGSSILTHNGILGAGNLSLTDNSILTHSVSTTTTTSYLELNVTETLTVDSTSSIDVTGKGYLPGRTQGNTTEGASENIAGGSYGGKGATGGNTPSGIVYGDLTNPGELGSGGGGYVGYAGIGGGLVKVKAKDIVFDGKIIADGSQGPLWGGGSGGCINITTETLSGSGHISVKGGPGNVNGSQLGGGGGGGRIAIRYTDMSGFGIANIDASGGMSYTPRTDAGGAGTIYLKGASQVYGDLIVDNRGMNSADTPLVSMVTGGIGDYTFDNLVIKGKSKLTSVDNISVLSGFDLWDGSELSANRLNITSDIKNASGKILVKDTINTGDITISDSTLFTGSIILGNLSIIRSNMTVDVSISAKNLSLTDNSILTHSGATTTGTSRLELNITETLMVDSTSKIDVTGKGYLQGRTIGNTVGTGAWTSGGSYGGQGAPHQDMSSSAGPVYGDLANPNELGSGGGGEQVGHAGFGGGLVKIEAKDIALEGSIVADGAQGPVWGGGSGGCINITTETLSGDGHLSVKGAPGSINVWQLGGGGGGGRIAIRYADMSGFDTLNIDASGGMSGYPRADAGGAGTIYLKGTSQTYGDLIVDNKGKNGANTPLRAVGMGTITALTPDTLTDDNASFPVPDPATGKLGLVGLRLNPNYPDNKAWTYRIIDNTDKTITTDPADGNLMTVASVGDTYIGEYWLNNLTIVNGAKVVTADNIWYDTIALTGGSIDANNIKQVGFMGSIPEQQINIGMNDDPKLAPVDMSMIASWAKPLKNTEARRHRGDSFEFPIIGVSSAKSYDPPSVPVHLNVLSITSNSEVVAYFQDTEYGESNFSLPVLAENSDPLSVPPCLSVSTLTDNSEVSAYSQSTGYEKSNFNLPVLAESSDPLSVPPCLSVSNPEITSSQIDMDPSYTYDLNGNRDTMTSPTGTTTYKYDKLNRLESITNPKGQTVTFEYDAIGRRTKMTYPNGVVTTYTYDKASRLLTLEAKLGANIITSFEYAYDNVGNRLSMTDLDGKHDYAYDDLYRLTDAAHPQTFNPAEHFTYDPVGNRLSSHLSASYDYDDANELLQDAKFDYDYDNNGNMIKQTDKSTNQSTRYTYDAENKLIKVEKLNSSGNVTSTSIYLYDGLGRRMEKNVDGAITRYLYDNEDILLELDGSNNILAQYTHGPGIDEPLIMERDGQSYYYHTDGLGSVVAMTDASGAVVQTYRYDAFGGIVKQDGEVLNPYTYTARELDAESGNYYYRARYYNAYTGRFFSEDPLVQGSYVYTGNSPITFIDPTGYGIDINCFKDCFNRLTFGIASIPGTIISSGLGIWAYLGGPGSVLIGKILVGASVIVMNATITCGIICLEDEALCDVPYSNYDINISNTTTNVPYNIPLPNNIPNKVSNNYDVFISGTTPNVPYNIPLPK